MLPLRLVCAAIIALALGAEPPATNAQPLQAGAATSPGRPVSTVPQRRLPGATLPQAAPAVPQTTGLAHQSSGPMKNAIYGTLVQINGSVLVIQSRAGRLRTVDASPAFAAGTISLPLFIGKLVGAEGLSRSNGVLSAARISRVSRLDHLQPDR